MRKRVILRTSQFLEIKLMRLYYHLPYMAICTRSAVANFYTLCQRFQWSCINELWCITVCRWYSNSMSCKEWSKFAANSWRYIKQDRSIYETKQVNFEWEKNGVNGVQDRKIADHWNCRSRDTDWKHLKNVDI